MNDNRFCTSSIFLILFLLTSLIARSETYGDEIHIPVHGTRTIRTKAGSPVRVKGKALVRVEDQSHALHILGLTPGHAVLTIGGDAHDVYIVSSGNFIFADELEALLKTYLGLTSEWRRGRVHVRGHLYRLSDWQAIAELARVHGADFQMEALMEPDLAEEATAWITERLKRENLSPPSLEVNPIAKAFISEDLKDHSASWDRALGPLGIARVYEKSQLALGPLVRVRIVVAEINKKLSSQLGVEWPEVLSAQVAPQLSGQKTIDTFLKAMEQNGLGQILASPNLLARSGSEAEFLAGGEFAIKIVTARMKDVIWKRHGIFLKIKPRADRSGRMSIELSTEVSLIDAAQTVDGIPGLKTNRMSTHFDLSTARTIILSGLIRNDFGESQSGVFGLSRIPIIGGLFRSRDFYNNKSELVIFVSPEILDEKSRLPEDLMPKGWEQK